MKKIYLIVSIDLILDNGKISEDFLNIHKEFNENIEFIFVSNDIFKRNCLKDLGSIATRKEIRGIITYLKTSLINEQELILCLGFKDEDYFLAQNNRFIFLTGDWKNATEKAEKYGLKVDYQILGLILKMALNNEKFYYNLKIDDKTELFSIIDPRNYYAESLEENTMISLFDKILKKNSKKYLDILKFLFLIMISKKSEFKTVDYWTSFPSSKGEPSENIQEIEKEIRILMGQLGKNVSRGMQDLLIRHVGIEKSHHLEFSSRKNCDRHFSSIHLNKQYENKLLNKTICILDDYSTNGTSSEVCRNLLKNLGVEKVYILTLGKFNSEKKMYEYIKQEYELKGDLFNPGYSWKLLSEEGLNGNKINNSNEIKKLYLLAMELEK